MNQERKRRSSVTVRPFLLVSSVLLRISNKNTSFHQRQRISEFSLPTEGLYSEVVRNPEFFDRLRREEQILVAGPSTLSALWTPCLSALKRSIFKKVQTISVKCWDRSNQNSISLRILAKTQRHLKNASNNIDDLLTRRTSAIERTLRQIESDEDLLGLDVYIEDGEDDGQN